MVVVVFLSSESFLSSEYCATRGEICTGLPMALYQTEKSGGVVSKEHEWLLLKGGKMNK